MKPKPLKVDRYLVIDSDGECKVVKQPPTQPRINEVVYRLSIELPMRPKLAGTIELSLPVASAEASVVLQAVAPSATRHLCPAPTSTDTWCREPLERIFTTYEWEDGETQQMWCWRCPVKHGLFRDGEPIVESA